MQVFNYESAAYSECLPGRATCIIVHLRDMSRLSLPVRPLPPTGTVGVLHDAEFLLFVGNKVREARSRRGMTRKMLAHEADVSERHLAQLELGEGNVSIVLLRRITTALNIPIAEVFTADKPNAEAEDALRRILERIPGAQLESVVSRLRREFGENDLARRRRIALIGLRGAGKSTLGSKLAEELGIPFAELDQEIEKDAGMDLAEIFSLYGQTGYRRIEKKTLDRVLREHARVVISIGGGVVSEKETYDQLLSNCFTVWIKAHPEEHMSRVVAQGDFRAMADNAEAMEDLRRILEAREPLYRRADVQLETSRETVAQSFLKLKQAVQSLGK
jgi:XRE family transcriptional regulator, aerobic/anaerobic benzoate catabolism transcriptional regulator